MFKDKNPFKKSKKDDQKVAASSSSENNNQPIILSDSLSLYSGDIVALNDRFFLVEIIDNEQIRLRKINENSYLFCNEKWWKGKNELTFTNNFDKSLLFLLEKGSNGKISLQTNNQYLVTNNRLSLSLNKEELTITKVNNYQGEISSCREVVEDIQFHLEKKKETPYCLAQTLTQTNHSDKEQKFTLSANRTYTKQNTYNWGIELSAGVETKVKTGVPLLVEGELTLKLDGKILGGSSYSQSQTESIQGGLEVTCPANTMVVAKSVLEVVDTRIPITTIITRYLDNRKYTYFVDGECVKGKHSQVSVVYDKEISSRGIIIAENCDVRNILIIGITGNGKSTLANVLTNTSDFKESPCSVGETKNFQKSETFEWKGKFYRVIDNIGFGDNRSLSRKDLLHRVGEGIYSSREGINQVLFVFKDKFANEQEAAFKMFKDFIAESGITKFTTLVRTNFPNFRTEQKCQEDKESLLTQSQELTEIMISCHDVIYVDNPSLEVDSINELELNKRKRARSREIVLNHLSNNCRGIYKLKEWDDISALVDNYLQKKGEIEKSSSSNSIREQEAEELENKINQEIEIRVEREFPTIKSWWWWR